MISLTANTWDELLGCVKEAKGALGNPKQLWFRGQSRAIYSLLPSLLRLPSGAQKEQELFQKFVQYSFRHFPRRTSDWETLFDMQHYGIPTRLTDWSENLGIATFFAVYYRNPYFKDENSAIYLLDAIALNKYSSLSTIPFVPDDPDFDYKKIYWHKKPFAPIYPIALQPLFQNDRILAQKGMFTVHGDNTDPIETLCPKAVKKIIVTPKAVVGAQEFLEIANIDARSVYPDMAGIADYVRKVAGI
jgi:hypothetical protein